MVDPTLIWAIPYLGAGLLALLWILGYRREQVYAWTSVGSILLSAILATIVASKVFSEGPVHVAYNWIPWLDVKVGTYVDGLGAVMALVVSWLSFLIAVYSVEYMKGDWGVQRYFFFFTFFVGSMLLLVLADNVLLMFIGWEGTGLASYALIGHWYTDEEEYWVGVPGRKALGVPMYFEPSHSGLRAIMFTRIGDIGLLIGMGLLYALTGTLSIPELAEKAPEWMAALAARGMLGTALFVFTLGALAKSAQFPFHEWLVTAMTGPTPVSALIHAATMVKAGVYFMLRFAPIFYKGAVEAAASHPALSTAIMGQVHDYFLAVAGLGAVTAFMMATMAIVNNEFKLILAFSTASQLGYMFMAAGAAGLLEGEEGLALGVAAGLSHLVSHAVFKAALFLIAGWAIHVVHSRFIDDMGEFAKYMKITAVSMWLAGLSLAGIPPFSGFFSKELVLKSTEEAHLGWVYLLGVITAGLTAAYTTRLILRVFHLPPYRRHGKHHIHEAPPLMLAPYTILAFAALLLGVAWPQVSGAIAKAWKLSLAVGVKPEVAVELGARVIAVILFVLASLATVVYLYMVARVNFPRIVETSAAARALFNFLFDRWYINAIIYLVFVYGFYGIAIMLAGVDAAIDWFYHVGLVALFGLGSIALRGLHRGRPDYYLTLYVYLAGIVLVLAVLLWR